MDRQEYLNRCQFISKIEKDVGKKPNPKLIPKEYIIEIGGVYYYPHSYELYFEDGKPKHRAILHQVGLEYEHYADLLKL